VDYVRLHESSSSSGGRLLYVQHTVLLLLSIPVKLSHFRTVCQAVLNHVNDRHAVIDASGVKAPGHRTRRSSDPNWIAMLDLHVESRRQESRRRIVVSVQCHDCTIMDSVLGFVGGREFERVCAVLALGFLPDLMDEHVELLSSSNIPQQSVSGKMERTLVRSTN
jgi:hypothetical protein